MALSRFDSFGRYRRLRFRTHEFGTSPCVDRQSNNNISRSLGGRGVTIHCLPYEIVLLVVRLMLMESGALDWTFLLDRLRLSHVCFKWRTIVLDNVEFWGHLQVNAAVPLAFLRSCLLRSKQTSLFIRLHLIGVKKLVDVTAGVHVNGSSSIGVLRALRPFLFQFEVLCVIFRGRRVLEELCCMFETHNFGRLRVLNMEFKPYLPHGPYRLTVDATIGFPLDMRALTTLRLRGVDVDWSISRPFHQLSILVLRDMGHRIAFTWAEFRDLLGGAPRLRKLAVVNVRCSNVPVAPRVLMPRLEFLTELYVSFGSHTSFKHVLGGMRCAPGLSLHLHAMMEQELEAFVRCIDMMHVATSFTYSGWACDPLCLRLIFEGLSGLTRLELLATNADILGSLLLSDQIGPNVHACPHLHTLFVGRVEPSAVFGFLKKRGEVLNAMKKVEDSVGLEDEYEDDFEWLRLKGIEVETGVEFGLPEWLSD